MAMEEQKPLLAPISKEMSARWIAELEELQKNETIVSAQPKTKKVRERKMVKFEGESGIDLIFLLGELRKRFKIKTGKEMKKLFVQACCRNIVFSEIEDMIEYILQSEGGSE